MDWKLYAVQVYCRFILDEKTKPGAPIAFISAPSPGAAVEVYLACHGILGYDYAKVAEISYDFEAHEDRHDVLKYYPDIEAKAQLLDSAHSYKLMSFVELTGILDKLA